MLILHTMYALNTLMFSMRRLLNYYHLPPSFSSFPESVADLRLREPSSLTGHSFSFSKSFWPKLCQARMHSSRIRTARFNGHLYRGDDVSAQGGDVWPNGVSAWGVNTPWTQGQTDPPDPEADTSPDPEADTPCPIACWDTPPPHVNRMTDRW